LKYKHLDFILINGMRRTSSERLPSWAPGWLYWRITSQAYGLAEVNTKVAKMRFCLGNSIGRNVPLGEGKVLRVQGITIGKIVAMNSTTKPMDVFSLSSSQSTSSALLSHPVFAVITTVVKYVRTVPHRTGHFECHNGTKPRRRYVQYGSIRTIEID
jgi:hypothetical protein